MSGGQMHQLIDIIILDLEHPGNTFAGKDLLIAKLSYVNNFNDAYLDEPEKTEINRILQRHKVLFRIKS